MKKYILFLFGFMVFVGCTKSPELTREQETPAARSSFTKRQLMEEIVGPWLAKDEANRKIGFANPTGSMLRVLDSKSICLLERVKPTDEIRVADLLVYKSAALGEEKNITHRLMKINDDGTLVFKGDNNQIEDPVVNRDSVMYRVVGVLYTNGM